MAQITLRQWVDELDKAGLLYRHPKAARVDELPQIMEDNPDQAVFVEHVQECRFPFFANGYASARMCALALGCDPRKVGIVVGERAERHQPARTVDTAPCKDVILKGDDVDLTILPLFEHHPFDGQAYINCGRVVTRNPDTGVQNDGIQRLMYRTPKLVNVDMRALAHGGAVNAHRYHDVGEDTPVAVVIGGPAADLISSMMRAPDKAIDAWDKLAGFVDQPVDVVKCETNDLTVPANADIVLEGRIITSEGLIHDEGPYGEYTGTYGAGLPRNWNVVIDCITYRKDAVYQYATISGLHPGRTDLYVWNAAIEGELFMTLKHAGLQVLDVHLPPDACSAVAYARIKQVAGGDSKQALGTMLTACRQWMPKMAYVFDEDIDIYNPERVMWAQAWRCNPGDGIMLIPGQNMIPLDPSIRQSKPPFSLTKVGYDCTIPLDADKEASNVATVTPPVPQPAHVDVLDEDELVEQMRAFIGDRPRSWYDILRRFAGQAYPTLYRAFGRLRPELGRREDMGPEYPYTFAETEFVSGAEVTKS